MSNPDEKTREFNRELCHLINKYSIENHSNTAGFVLANYLMGCLEAFNDAVNVRTNLSQSVQTSDKSDNPSGCDSGTNHEWMHFHFFRECGKCGVKERDIVHGVNDKCSPIGCDSGG